MSFADVVDALRHARYALTGDSNDAEHEALFCLWDTVVRHFNVDTLGDAYSDVWAPLEERYRHDRDSE